MKTYEVAISYTAYAHYTVEAESEEEAEQLAWEQYDPSDADNYGGSDIYDITEVENESE